MSDRSNPIALVLRRSSAIPAAMLTFEPKERIAFRCSACEQYLALSAEAYVLHRILAHDNERAVLLVCEPCARGPMRAKLHALSKVNRVIYDGGRSPAGHH